MAPHQHARLRAQIFFIQVSDRVEWAKLCHLPQLTKAHCVSPAYRTPFCPHALSCRWYRIGLKKMLTRKVPSGDQAYSLTCSSGGYLWIASSSNQSPLLGFQKTILYQTEGFRHQPLHRTQQMLCSVTDSARHRWNIFWATALCSFPDPRGVQGFVRRQLSGGCGVQDDQGQVNSPKTHLT